MWSRPATHLCFYSLSELLQSAAGLRGHALWHELLRRLRNVLSRTHLYVLLHEWVLVVLQLVLHSLRAAPIFPVVAHLLRPYNSLDTALGHRGCWSLIINSGHVMIRRLVCPWDLLVLHLLSLLPFVATLLLHVHLHRVVVHVVRVVWIIIVHEPIASLNISSRISCPDREHGSVAGRGTITIICLCRLTDSKVSVVHINFLKILLTFFLIQILHIWRLLLWHVVELEVIYSVTFLIIIWVLAFSIWVIDNMIVVTFVAWVVMHPILF